jgi:inorganic pyrophosphatase
VHPSLQRIPVAALLAATGLLAGCTIDERTPAAVADASLTPDSTVDLLRSVAPRDASGKVQVVIEIPAGTNAKWEVDKGTGRLAWEQRDGRPRVVAFLPYPGNYGFVPRTLLPREAGGDGDPLDVLVLGPAVPRGSVMAVRLLGVLAMQDGGETDDKLIAVAPDGPFGDVASLAELRQRFPGALELVADWFAHYKGPGVVSLGALRDQAVADSILQTAIAAFRD